MEINNVFQFSVYRKINCYMIIIYFIPIFVSYYSVC